MLRLVVIDLHFSRSKANTENRHTFDPIVHIALLVLAENNTAKTNPFFSMNHSNNFVPNATFNNSYLPARKQTPYYYNTNNASFNRMVHAQTHNQAMLGQPRQQQQMYYQNPGMNNTMPVPSAPPMPASSYVPQRMANTQPPHTMMTGLNYGPMHPMHQSRANPRIIAANSAYTNAPSMMVPQQPYYPSRAYASTINNYTPPPSSSFAYTGALPYPYNTSGNSAAATQRANATAKAQQEMLRESERLRRTEQKLSQSRLEQLEIQRLQAETHRAAGM